MMRALPDCRYFRRSRQGPALGLSVGLLIAGACSSTSQGIDEAACATFTGGYVITDACSGDRLACSVTQEGCAAQLACVGQPDRVMELSGDTASFTTDDHGACTGTLSGTLVEGSCEDGCDIQGARLTEAPGTPALQPVPCGFRISSVVPAATEACDTCAETDATCCAQMETCAAPSPCNALLVCVKKNCALDANVVTCAETECPALTAAGGQDLIALVACLSNNCPSCGIAL